MFVCMSNSKEKALYIIGLFFIEQGGEEVERRGVREVAGGGWLREGMKESVPGEMVERVGIKF